MLRFIFYGKILPTESLTKLRRCASINQRKLSTTIDKRQWDRLERLKAGLKCLGHSCNANDYFSPRALVLKDVEKMLLLRHSAKSSTA